MNNPQKKPQGSPAASRPKQSGYQKPDETAGKKAKPPGSRGGQHDKERE